MGRRNFPFQFDVLAAVQNPGLSCLVSLARARAHTDQCSCLAVLDPIPADYRGTAEFVDVIHATFLSDWAAGDAQFFPNNGRLGGRVPWGSAHIASIYLYQHSVLGDCDFRAWRCDSYEQFTNHE